MTETKPRWGKSINNLIHNLREHVNSLRKERNELVDQLSYADLRASGGLPEREAPPSKFESMTREQQRHCEFMGFDPDNPDVPLG